MNTTLVVRFGKITLTLFFLVYAICLSPKTWAAGVIEDNQIPKINNSDICVEIQKMFDNRTINSVFVGSPKENYRKSFYADIDNDGIDEELQYFYTRTYAYVAEIVDGKRLALPSLNTSQGMGNYTGNAIIKYNEKFLQYHFGKDGPLEIQQLTEKTSDEKLGNPEQAHINYDAKTICKYYED